MHGKSRLSSAISVCYNSQNFKIGFSTVAIAQWVRRWSSSHRVVQAEGSSPGGEIYQIYFFSNDFYFSFVRPNGGLQLYCEVGQIVVANKTLIVLICLYYS